MHQLELPPLTGSALFDPWRLRYRRTLEERGVQLRERRPTRSEVLLWEQLRWKSPEWFAEVPTTYGYTLDFFCPAARLAVEVDGGSHWGLEAAQHDAARDGVHDRMGVRTHRFSARDVERDTAGVVAEIDRLLDLRFAQLAAPVGSGTDEEDVAADELLTPDPVVDHQPTWSAYLPACRTVLPEVVGPKGVLQRLAAGTKSMLSG